MNGQSIERMVSVDLLQDQAGTSDLCPDHYSPLSRELIFLSQRKIARKSWSKRWKLLTYTSYPERVLKACFAAKRALGGASKAHLTGQ